jgi:Epoxide hydrolase N terminus
MSSAVETANEIRPFNVDVPDEAVEDLRRRIAATRWPDRGVDPSQGVQLETIQALADYWANDYDWRKFEERFAALPHFVTEIDGSTSTSFTFGPTTRTRCHSSSRTGGPARPWSSSRSSSL